MLHSRGLTGPIKATCLLGIYLDMLGKQNFIHIFQMKAPEKSNEIGKKFKFMKWKRKNKKLEE